MEYIISFPTDLNKINIFNDNIDVCLQLQDGRQYTLVVTTPDNLKDLMAKEQLPYLKPCLPFLFVETITKENIYKLIEELLKEDTIFLQIYGGDL